MSIPFKDHPKDVQDLIMIRVEEDCKNSDEWISDMDSVKSLFIWERTPEGLEFWRAIDNGDYSVMKTLPDATDRSTT